MTSSKSVIFVTTTTSGSASLWRILTAIYADRVQVTPTANGKVKALVEDFEPEGHIYLVRGRGDVGGPIFDKRFRYIVNFRDPRDVICNQYHWLVQHAPGKPTDNQAKIAAERKKRHELGIDGSVLRMKDDRAFNFVYELQAAAEAGGDVLFVSYAQLCCGFDILMKNLEGFIGGAIPSPARAQIDLERPENLSNNPNWIGQTWTGTDFLPGRYRNELQPETIATLNERFDETLRRLRMLEVPELRHLYSV